MVDSSEVTSPVGGSSHGNKNHDQSTSGQNNYTARPPTFNGDTTEFELWKSNMYTHMIGMDDELCDISEDGIKFHVNGVRMVSDKKSLTPYQKTIYRKHYRVIVIHFYILPHFEYIKIIDKSNVKTI